MSAAAGISSPHMSIFIIRLRKLMNIYIDFYSREPITCEYFIEQKLNIVHQRLRFYVLR